MNLSDFMNMMIADNGEATVYVFSDEDERDNFRKDGSGTYDFVISSCYKLRYVMLPEYAKAKVRNFHAVGENVVDVLIDPDEMEEYVEEAK